MRIALIVALVAALALSVGACGRKGKPEEPPGSTFPRTYPTR
jgi:predicted small lipoprotein YifL